MTSELIAVSTEPVDDGSDGAIPRSRYRLANVFGLAAAMIGAGLGASRIGDNSFLTHLATGREMLDTGFVREDVFTWTSQGESIVVQSWLASLLYGVVDEIAGFHGLRLLTAVLAATLAWMCWILTERSAGLFTRVALMVPVLVIGRTTWSERPLLIAFVLLAGSLLVAEGRGRPKWLLLAGIVWIGVHGSWPLGLVVLGTRWVGARLDGQRGSREIEAGKWLALGMLVGGVVNPYGPALLLFPLRLLGRQEILSHIVEWRSPEFNALWTRAFLLMVLAGFVSAARHPRWREILPGALVVALALVGRRNVPIAMLVLLPALAAGLPVVGRDLGRRTSGAIRLAAQALVVLLVLVPFLAAKGPHLQLDRFPEDAITAMEENGLAPGQTRIIHQDFVGNYLDIRYGASAATWIDDRFELHEAELVEDYLVLLEARTGWADVLDRYAAEALLWPRDAALVELAIAVEGWVEVWVDDDWAVLCNPDRLAC